MDSRIKSMFDRAEAIIEERSPIYSNFWIQEDINDCYGNLKRKLKAVNIMHEGGKTRDPEMVHQLLDIMNYAGITATKIVFGLFGEEEPTDEN